MTERTVLLVTHTGRAAAATAVRDLATRLRAHGLTPRLPTEEHAELALGELAEAGGPDPAAGCELVVALGGDGTLLRAAELARPGGVPLLGINLGHVGFLTEAERTDIEFIAAAIERGDYTVERRLTLEVAIAGHPDGTGCDWALNDVTVERVDRARVLDVMVAIDDRPLSRWGCDGVICATPTGSTAYAFSAGGPVVWPTVEAVLVVPINAHALFARPLVVGPDSAVTVEVVGDRTALLVCDGRRQVEVAGLRVEVRRSHQPLQLVRLRESSFTDRLVEKFQLPVAGWRGRAPEE